MKLANSIIFVKVLFTNIFAIAYKQIMLKDGYQSTVFLSTSLYCYSLSDKTDHETNYSQHYKLQWTKLTPKESMYTLNWIL